MKRKHLLGNRIFMALVFVFLYAPIFILIIFSFNAGFVYDWEGDPTKDKSPILSRIAYGSIEHFRNKGMETPRFAYINFVDMSRTVRVNVLSPQYMSKGNESLFIRNIIMTLMKNLEASWKEKTDFWANNAINYVYSIAYKCFKERKLGICTQIGRAHV